MSNKSLIEQILEQKAFAVLGVSSDKAKPGHQVYKTLKSTGYTVYAINPKLDSVDGDPCYPSLDNVPGPIDVLVTVTPPAVTEEAIHIAGRLRIPYLWMQPGSESMPAFNLAQSQSMEIVSGGPCIMESIKERAES